ncbi:MAG: porin family protein [Bacteroidetes bacterium]|nr:MAG: porin family protein [Bacteroidota bacterium]
MKPQVFILSALLALGSVLSLEAQKQYSFPNRLIQKGQVDIFATVGWVPTFMADKGRQLLPPINVGMDYMVSPNLSVGAAFGYSLTRSASIELADNSHGTWQTSYYEFGVRTGLHLTRWDNFDLYGGLALSYHLSNVEASNEALLEMGKKRGVRGSSGKFIPAGFLGVRYAFSDRWTLMAEMGYGVSLFRTGVGLFFGYEKPYRQRMHEKALEKRKTEGK